MIFKMININKINIYHIVCCIILAVMALNSCKQEPIRIVKDTYPDGSPKAVQYSDKPGSDNNEYILKTYYNNRKIMSEGKMIDGKMSGRWVYYFENGKKWSEGYFLDGIEEGKRTAYYDNGLKRYEGIFRNGQKTGIWKFWDASGKLVQKIKY